VLEHAAIVGALTGESDSSIAQKVAERLDLIAPETSRGWTGEITEEGSLSFTRVVRGVGETRLIDTNALKSSEARRLQAMHKTLAEVYTGKAVFTRKEKNTDVRSPAELLDIVLTEGEKGLSLQRYKGLGEMNPGQLWETTLDPEARTLLQVQIDHVDEANEIFTKLMGDVVEPRRNFIQENALNVENLDA